MKHRSFRFVVQSAMGIAMPVMVVASGCEREESPSDSAPKAAANQSSAALPDQLFVSQPLEGARSIADVKADMSATGNVVVKGRIGGRGNLFVKGAAVFLLADTSMKSCKERHEEKCPTPWDYCCEDPASLSAKIATVQIVGDDGRPLRVDAQGRRGLDPLATIVVAGEISPRDDTGTLVINAKRIYVEREGG